MQKVVTHQENILQKNMIFVGMQGVGKTFFGKKLALSFGLPFFDVDEELLKNEGVHSIPELYKTLGKEHFRQKEAEVAIQLVEATSSLIAFGGGTLMDKKVQAKLVKKREAKESVVIYLSTSKEKVWQGFETRRMPQYIENKEAFFLLFQERHHIFQSFADQTVDVGESTYDELCQYLFQQLGKKVVFHGK